MSTIVFLNGSSSVGKSTIVKAFQYINHKPWLAFGLDSLFFAMPSQYVGFGNRAEEGFHFIPEHDEKGSHITLKCGPFAHAVATSVPKVIKTLADEGHDLIVDELLFADERLGHYAEALSAHTIYFVGIVCELKAMEEREILRGDRALGLARGLMDKVHSLAYEYDLTIDTTHISSFEGAHRILDFINKNQHPQGFINSLKRLRDPTRSIL